MRDATRHLRWVIDRTTFDDLRKIAKIRNRFAHHHLALSFGDPEIGRLCDAMSPKRDPVHRITGKLVRVPHISESVSSWPLLDDGSFSGRQILGARPNGHPGRGPLNDCLYGEGGVFGFLLKQ